MKLIIRTDGGSRGNPGPAGAGIVIRDEDGTDIFVGGFFLGVMTNNLAEYHAVIKALDLAQNIGAEEIVLFSDSELLVRQVNGQYRVKNQNIKFLYQQVIDHISRFASVVVTHVYRDENADADAMVNRAITAQSDVGGVITGRNSKEQNSSRTGQQVEKSETQSFQILDLEKKINLNGKASYQEMIELTNGFTGVLVGLNPNQSYLLRQPKNAAVIILKGQGELIVNRTKNKIKPNDCVRWFSPEQVEFVAGRGPLCFLITQTQTPPD